MNLQPDPSRKSLLHELLEIAKHPEALHRSKCPSVDDLARLAAAARASDLSVLEAMEGNRPVFMHLRQCRLCRSDFLHLGGVVPPAEPLEGKNDSPATQDLRAMAKEMFDLSDRLLDWKQGDVMLFRPVIDLIVRLTHVSLRSIEAVRRGKASVVFQTPEPAMILDRILAGALAAMRVGDSYASTTTFEFWRSILRCPEKPQQSAFFQRMVQALILGVHIRRMLPVSVDQCELLEAIAHLQQTGDARGFPDDYRFLVPHIELAKSYPNYEFRILLTGTDRHPVAPLHFGFGHWGTRGVCIAFRPTYTDGTTGEPARLTGLRVVTDTHGELLRSFESAWLDAFDVRSFVSGENAKRWLGTIPTEALMAAVERLPQHVIERLMPALADVWQERHLEGLPPFYAVAAG
jgi:hypothetical protein